MKIYAFTDHHGSPSDLEYVKKKSKDADIILCGGDFTIFENEIEYIMNEMNKLPKKVLLIHGNHEDDITVRALCSSFSNLIFIHQEIHIIGEYAFVGYGGGGFSTHDLNFENWTKTIARQLEGKKVVLMLHGPPHGTKADKMAMGYVGNKSFAKFIKEHQPELVICGHIHETFGRRDTIGKSKVINPGPIGEMIEL
jgi:uncharacterized protein